MTGLSPFLQISSPKKGERLSRYDVNDYDVTLS